MVFDSSVQRGEPATFPLHGPRLLLVHRDEGAILQSMSERRGQRSDPHGGHPRGGDAGLDEERGVITETRPERRLKRPKLYKVLLHNDDYTTMEFVVYVLQTIFHRSETDAVQIMLHVHKNGIGVAGVYTYEVAEIRVAQVEALARRHEFPLRCSVEEA